MGTRTVYIGKPLIKLSNLLGRGGRFSAAMNSIADRYALIMELTSLPVLDEKEIDILKKVIADEEFSGFKIRSLHLAILECEAGTRASRNALAKKIEALSIAQKVKLFDKITKQPFLEAEDTAESSSSDLQ